MTKKTTKGRWAILAAIVSLTMGSADTLFAQGVSINGTGARADTSAILDITSTTKGFLLPRMNETQRDAIVQPKVGLQVYNTSTDKVNIYMGSYWKEVTTNCSFTPSTPSYAPTTPTTGSTLSLSGTTVSGATYSWTGPNSFTSSSQNPTISNISASEGGTYYLTTTVSGCVGSPVAVTVPTPVYTPITTSWTYTGSEIQWTVPTGATGIIYDMYGAKGGNAGCTGGQGGRVQGKYAVSGGTLLYIYLGGTGSNCSGCAGYNYGGQPGYSGNWGWGAGGGGGSDIRRGGNALSNRVAVAGGGGGTYNGWNYGCSTGGVGGGLTGGAGQGNWPGQGGNQSNGGSQGNNGSPGSLGTGGTGWCGGGGGGGGYYGGGGGGWGQGGGGSNFVDPTTTQVTHTQGGNSGNGTLSITTY